MTYFKNRSTSVQGTVTLRIPLQFQPRIYPCGSCLSLVPTSWEIVLKPAEAREGAPFPQSVKVYNLLFLELALCTACLLSARTECFDYRDRAAQLCSSCVAGDMAHTRAGPSSLLCKSTLVSVNFSHLLIPLAQKLNTEEGGTLKCLPWRPVWKLYPSLTHFIVLCILLGEGVF